SAFARGIEFFREDLGIKLQSRLPLDTGYRPYGEEYSQDESHPDEVESFTASRRVPNADALLHTRTARQLNSEMLPLFDVFEAMAQGLSSSLANAMGIHDPQVRSGFKRWSLLQMNCSRPSRTDA